jgi:hypothetical protein
MEVATTRGKAYTEGLAQLGGGFIEVMDEVY